MTPSQAEVLFDALILDHPNVIRLMAIAEPRVLADAEWRMSNDSSREHPRHRVHWACKSFGEFLIEWGIELHETETKYGGSPAWPEKLKDALRRVVLNGKFMLDNNLTEKQPLIELIAIAEEALK